MRMQRWMWGALGLGVAALTAGGAAVAATPISNPQTAKGPEIATGQEQQGAASPEALVGLWRVSQTNEVACSDRPQSGTLPDQDNMILLHGDGTATLFLGTHNFGSYGVMPSNAVGALGTWTVSGRDLSTYLVRYLFVPTDPNNVINTQRLVGYTVVRTHSTIVDENNVSGTVELRAVYTGAEDCAAIGKSAPCLARCFDAKLTLKRSDPFPVPEP